MDSTKTNFEFFKKNRDKLLEKYNNKFIVIVDSKIVGDFESERDAILFAMDKYDMGDFIVQQCISDDKVSGQVFHSRVAFIG